MKKAMSQLVLLVLTMGFAISLAITIQSCGFKKSKSSPGGPIGNKVENAFLLASQEAGIPARLMLAVAYLESRMVPDKSTARYELSDELGTVDKTIMLSDSAFNIPVSAMGLPDDVEGRTLEKQTKAYAVWVRDQLKAKRISLPPNPVTADEKFSWIWELADIHRTSKSQRQNVNIIFAKELIAVLNDGFIWQNPKDDETLHFAKESPPIKIEELSSANQQLLKPDTVPADISLAYYYPLASVQDTTIENVPTHIEVIHCPLTLSACLEIQDKSPFSEVRLGAHYVIPQDFKHVDRLLQLVRHEKPVMTINERGEEDVVKDAIILMLVGNSGRFIDGIRNPVDPTWMTSTQLEWAAKAINELCTLLEGKKLVDRAECMSVGGEKGVRFHAQTGRSGYKWGDVSDYDELIVKGYLDNPGGLRGSTVFEFSEEKHEYAAGNVAFDVLFQPRVKLVQVQRLVRCPDKRLVWALIQSDPVRSVTKKSYQISIYDSGPNGNGNHFVRSLVMADKELLGWAVDKIYLKNFEGSKDDESEPGDETLAPQYCQ